VSANYAPDRDRRVLHDDAHKLLEAGVLEFRQHAPPRQTMRGIPHACRRGGRLVRKRHLFWTSRYVRIAFVMRSKVDTRGPFDLRLPLTNYRSIRQQIIVPAQNSLDVNRGARGGIGICHARYDHTERPVIFSVLCNAIDRYFHDVMTAGLLSHF